MSEANFAFADVTKSDGLLTFDHVWSPDGKRIAYVSLPKSSGGGNLRIVNSDGTGLHTVVALTDSTLYAPAWAPAGDVIAYAVSGSSGTQLYTVDVTSKVSRRLSVLTRVSNPAWSPDGSRIAFAGYTATQTILGVMTRDGNGASTVTIPLPLTQTPNVCWSPDGSKVYMAAGVVYVVNVTAQGIDGLHALTAQPAEGGRIVCSRTGRLAFRSPDLSSVYIVNGDGSGLTKLVLPTGQYLDLDWTADGQRLVLSLREPDLTDSIVITPGDGTWKTVIQAAYYSPRWNPKR